MQTKNMKYIFSIISISLVVSSCITKDSLYDELSIMWKTDRPVNPNSLIIHNDNIYCHGDSTILKINLENGKTEWEIRNQGSYLSSRPLAIEEDIYFAGRHVVQRVNSEGEVIWKINTGQKTFGLTHYQNLIINCRTNQGLFANDIRTGQEVWSIKPNCQSLSPSKPTISDNMLFIGNFGSQEMKKGTGLYCLDIRTQSEVWSYEDESCNNYGQPITDSDFVYCNLMDTYLNGYTIKLNKKTGNLIWRIKSNPEVAITPVIKDTIIYISSFEDGIKAINKESGGIIFRGVKMGNQSHTELLYHENSIIYGSQERELITVDKNGKVNVISRFEYGIGTPVKNGKTLYVMDGNGKLIKIRSYQQGTIR